jgi:hypothetical protein
MARVWRDPAWLAGTAGVDPSRVEDILRAARGRRILGLRRLAAKVAFENLVYAESSLEPSRLHADVVEQMMQDTRRKDPGWAADLFLITRPLERLSTLSGALAAADLAAAAAARWPDAMPPAGATRDRGSWNTSWLPAPPFPGKRGWSPSPAGP